MSDGKILRFTNAILLRNHQLIKDDLWVRDGKILDPQKVFFDEKCKADVWIDCQDKIISPGFIDLQINGAFGIDFSLSLDNLQDGVKKVAKELLSHGVTSFVPTVVTSPSEVYHKIVPQFERFEGGKHGAGVLGLHLEGPFISEEKRGAHDAKCLSTFKQGWSDMIDMYGSSFLSNTSIVTLAPELPFAIDVIKELVSRYITVSLGHSMADLKQGELAVRAGSSFITHLFNAMLPFHHRDPHLVGLLASDHIPPGRTVFYGIIADGIHTHPAALRIAYRTHFNGLVLITDAIPAMGLSTGLHHIGSQAVEIKDKRAVIAGTNILCGSIATMNECIRYFQGASGCSTVEALECATLHPAQLLGISNKKGTLDYGADADFVRLNDSLDVEETYIGGSLVWSKQCTMNS